MIAIWYPVEMLGSIHASLLYPQAPLVLSLADPLSVYI